MNFIEKHGKLVRELYDISNPIIKYHIDKEWYRKEGISIEHYISFEEEPLNYWLNVYNPKKIHGREDCTYENSIAKLLDFGLTRENNVFDKLYSYLLEDKHWQQDYSFEGILMKTVKYPFLIRAGYWNDKNVNSFFMNRLEKIERTIKKYGYEFEGSKKYKDQFVFKFVNQLESLPTIYDLYAFTYYPKNDTDITNRIEKIIEYILDDQYQQIPNKAYIYDSIKKRYYAAGNVYHACMIEVRKLLYLHLLSHFKVIGKYKIFMGELEKLLTYKGDDGFYKFDKSIIYEKKDSYYIYSGNHMGLGEKRTNKNWSKIESTLWMLKIIYNLENNNIFI